MFRVLVSIATAAFVWAGCAPLSIYHKTGAPVATMERDRVDCEVTAAGRVPVNTQIRRTAPEYIPGRRKCDRKGNCVRTPGYYIPGDIYTVDVNRGLRRRVVMQCMADRGYLPVSIPPCPESVARATPAAITRILPPLTPQSCVIRNNGGSWQIVNP